MPSINYTDRQRITAQALTEIAFARQFKQGKVKNWKKNEDLYYARKIVTEESRANVDLGLMQSYVHTILSKIDNPMVFKYTKRKNAQLERVLLLNALRNYDENRDAWDMKDLVGKKQGVIYGRAVYAYHADSHVGYCPHLENVDVYDFLVDPAGGGIDLENAMFMGRYGVVKTKAQLRDGMKDKIYLKTETEVLLEGGGNSTEMPQEKVNQQNRTVDQNVWISNKEIGNINKYIFWEWYTTDLKTGERYYLLINERAGTTIRIEKLSDLFASNLWPFWTWAPFPDLTEFWTPSYCDYVREVFMAQAISINQMLDNSEQINKPQKIVQVGAIENLAELKYRRDGYIKVKKGIPADQALQTIKVAQINTPVAVYNLLDAIQEKASGVTAADKGAAVNNSGSKATIYEGNQVNSADRFGLLNRSYSFGYTRFARLWEAGVREHLSKKISIDILGPDGIEMKEVSRRDIFRSKDESFGLIVESSNAELALSEKTRNEKFDFLSNQSKPVLLGQPPVQNQQKAYELMAQIRGFDEETIRELQDTSDYGTSKIMSEADRDIESILDGKKIEPNQAANNAYKQRFVDWLRDHQEDISDPQTIEYFFAYITSLQPIIDRNMTREGNTILSDAILKGAITPTAPVLPGGAPNGETPLQINR